MIITPKNYSLLYTNEFHVTGWEGETEFQFSWENKIKYKVTDAIDFHSLIKNYRQFVKENKNKIKISPVLFCLDNSIFYLKEIAKLVLKRGMGFRRQND